MTRKAREELKEIIIKTRDGLSLNAVGREDGLHYSPNEGTIDAIIQALTDAGQLRTEGTVEVCSLCGEKAEFWPTGKHTGGTCISYEHVENGQPCPLKQ